MYKYFNTKTQYNSTIIVDILTGIFIPNRSITNKKNTRISKRSILDCNRYLELSSKGMLNNKKRYMFLKDYLYLFKMAKIGNIMELCTLVYICYDKVLILGAFKQFTICIHDRVERGYFHK